MRLKLLLVLSLLLLAALPAGSAMAVPPSPLTHEGLSWELSKVEVTQTGQTTVMPEGILTSGYTLEGKARATNGHLVPDGKFRLEISAFTPARDLPGQKVGRWYIVGQWSITRSDATPKSEKARHNRDTLQGRIRTELTFDPTRDAHNWSALATLPMSLAAGRWGRGTGTLSFDAQLNGSLFLGALLWPELQGGGQQ